MRVSGAHAQHVHFLVRGVADLVRGVVAALVARQIDDFDGELVLVLFGHTSPDRAAHSPKTNQK